MKNGVNKKIVAKKLATYLGNKYLCRNRIELLKTERFRIVQFIYAKSQRGESHSPSSITSAPNRILNNVSRVKKILCYGH
jgi:hypothetical protein